MKLIKRILIIAVILFVAVHFFNVDVAGLFSAGKTLVLDTVEKIIPGSRAEFENIDAQINGAVVRSGAAKTLKNAAGEAIENAGRFLNKSVSSIKKFAAKFGINLNFDFSRFIRQKRSGSSGSSNYSFDFANLDVTELSNLRQNFINYSMTLRGIPYKLGSETPANGFDCSGFVRYSARNGINVKLPRTAKEMYLATTNISSSEREPGDLVFFRRFGKIDHVGIYLGRYEGSGSLNGREIFINSASEGPRTGVVVSALDEPYWRRHYSSSGRFLPSFKETADAQEMEAQEASSSL